MEYTMKPSDTYDSKVTKEVIASQLILIVKPNRSELVNQAASGLISALASYVHYPQIIPINGDNNAEELAALLRDNLHQHPKIDLIFSLGLLSTQVIQAVMRELKRSVPTYFIGVVDPVEKGFVASLEEPGSYMTGVRVVNRDYEEQIEGLLYVTGQSFNHVVVPHCDFGNGVRTRDEDLNGMIRALKQRNITVTTVNFQKKEDVVEKVKPLLPQADIICIPRDTFVMEYASAFVELANQRGIPLFTSDTDSVVQGAAIGFGSSSYEFAKEVGMWAQPLLIEGASPATFPVAFYSHWKGHIAINKEAAQKQNLSIDMNCVFAQEKCKTALW